MYKFGQTLEHDDDFLDHKEKQIPVQVYFLSRHVDIGFIEWYSRDFVKMNGLYYSRKWFRFVSRPGY